MHVAAIMDGNRRWAQKQGWKKIIGHKYGVNLLKDILKWSPCHGIDVFTIYALSTENLKRQGEELNHLYDLILEFAKDIDSFQEQNIKVKLMGKIQEIREDSAQALFALEQETQNCTGLTFQICINYGGRDEIVRAVEKLVQSGEEISELSIEQHLDSPLQPDLIIRTGGHQRLSNFLPWQSSYSELYFLEKFWPDFSEDDLEKAVNFYKKEQRNFGK